MSIMNAYYDVMHSDQVVHKGSYTKEFDDLVSIAASCNTHKCVLNFWTEDLQAEHKRIQSLGICSKLTEIKYIKHKMPYYYFQCTDPDDNVIEITGPYTDNTEVIL